jgi:hypothetical protein
MVKTKKTQSVMERFQSIRYAAVKLLRPPKASSPVKLAYLDVDEADAVYLKRIYSKYRNLLRFIIIILNKLFVLIRI